MENATAVAECLEGVELGQLPALTTLFVWTWNSLYRLVVLGDSVVCVQGGSHFPDVTTADFEGASMGRGPIIAGWICVGLVMGFRVRGSRVMTTPVLAISSEAPGETTIH
jgi:hypothetical protein